MASPVDTSVKLFYSTMSGAPQGFRGVAGFSLPIFLACLVNGFDEVTLTSLVVSGGVATATFPSTHSSVPHAVVLIAGATGTGLTDLNGEQKIVTKVGNTVTFATACPDGTAGGTITMKMAPAGWAQEYTGTNLLALRATSVAGNRRYLRLQDTATTTLRALGYEVMTAIGTGTGPFPTTAQLSGGCYWPKSDLATTTDNPWMIVADGKRFYLGVAPGYSTDPTYGSMNLVGFGDFLSYRKVADPYATMIATGGSSALAWDGSLAYQAGAISWAPRTHTGVGTSTSLDTMSSVGAAASVSGLEARLGLYPGLSDSLYLSKSLVGSVIATNGPRGELSGLWMLPQLVAHGTFSLGDTVTGGGETAGRTLMAMPVSSGSANPTFGCAMFDVTGPWA